MLLTLIKLSGVWGANRPTEAPFWRLMGVDYINKDIATNKSQPVTPVESNKQLSFRHLAIKQTQKVNAERHANGEAISSSGKIIYKAAAEYVEKVLNAVRRRKTFSVNAGLKIIRQIAEDYNRDDQLFSLAIHLDVPSKYPLLHSVNVAVYAMRMAADLNYPRNRQIEIGLSGLLHDVGMALMPDSIIYKRSAINAKEKAVLRNRPNYSYKILKSLGPDFAFCAECAGQVYERIDGSGYPRKLKADEIHEYAQIIGLVDVYESLIHSRPHRPKMTSFAAVKELFSSSKNRFQRTYLKSLLNVFTVFPIHSYVRLNSGAIGKVVETHVDQPLRPKLKVVLDSHSRKVLTKRIVDLPQMPLLNIVDSVSNDNIKAIYNGDALECLADEVNCLKIDDLIV